MLESYRTGAVFVIEDESDATFDRLFTKISKLDGLINGLKENFANPIPETFFAGVGKASDALKGLVGVAETSREGILKEMGLAGTGMSTVFTDATTQATGKFGEINTLFKDTARDTVSSITSMGAGIGDLLTGAGSASTTMSTSIVTEMGKATAAIDTSAASMRTLITEATTASKSVADALAAGAAATALPSSRLPGAGGLRSGHGGGDGGMHFGRVGTEIPGGHVSMSGTPLLAALGVAGAAVIEAGEVEDIVTKAMITGQLPMGAGGAMNSDAGKRLVEMIQKGSSQTGYSVKDTGEAFLGIERMLGGVDFNTRLSVMDTLMPFAGLEARMKEGTSLKESFESFVGIAHMTGEYRPEKLKELAKAFAFTSINTTAPLPQFEKNTEL